ncbi:tyrosine--tRNA ligase [Sphingobacterium bambusae]|uniref:Tyrosine--tRNA ligase n=1 Tax=Sphingobacterium bambusae TaxID=662858 RepID=A0ABW6BNN6_9SPHI|nr:tyrosine--tRNA ligase [Sphingobacterium bambusae]WPL47805.1 tyrosine--tRNA ligase [Sphingobacterium bambusae]
MLHKLRENVEIILPEQGLQEKIQQASDENRPLTIKLGFDPTSADLHLGHAVVLKKIRQFQDLGHHIVIVVGSFTARIGDPTGKNKSRIPLTIDEVEHNAQTYIQQLSRIIDVQKAKVVFNSDWLDQLCFSDIIQIISRVTVAQLLHRNDFNKRFTENSPISMHELLYPILQGYDSVHISCDIEMGGTDQLFNCTMGRQLQETYGKSPQIVLCMPLLKGTDGKEKMSKSLHNTIGLTDTPQDMYGKTMSIPDSLIPEFIRLTTDFTPDKQQALFDRLAAGENPMLIKKLIAMNLVTQYHDVAHAEKAQTFFEQQFQRKSFFEKHFKAVKSASVLTESNSISLLDLCVKLQTDKSKSAIRRLIEGGAVEIDQRKHQNPEMCISPTTGMKIRIGKQGYFELVD